MSFSLNKIQIIGNLGKDAEHRTTTNGTGVTSFSVATSHSYKGKDNKYVDETTWHNVVLFGATEFLKGVLKKGAKFFIEGRLAKRDYENKEGVKVYVTEIIGDKFGIIPLGNDNHTKPETLEPADDDDLPFWC